MPSLFNGGGIFQVNNTLIERITEEPVEVLNSRGYPPAAWSGVPGAPRGE